MRLLPGDRIVISQDAWSHEYSVFYNSDVLDATQGSIVRVLSDAEYREIFYRTPDLIIRDHFIQDDPAHVENERKKGTQCALMFETVAPCKVSAHTITCAVGKVIVLDERFFQEPGQD